MSRMHRWMSWHSVPGAGDQIAERLRAEAREDRQLRFVRFFVDVEGEQLACISEAETRADVESWFAARGYPPTQLGEVRLEGDHASIHEIAMYSYIAPWRGVIGACVR